MEKTKNQWVYRAYVMASLLRVRHDWTIDLNNTVDRWLIDIRRHDYTKLRGLAIILMVAYIGTRQDMIREEIKAKYTHTAILKIKL